MTSGQQINTRRTCSIPAHGNRYSGQHRRASAPSNAYILLHRQLSALQSTYQRPYVLTPNKYTYQTCKASREAHVHRNIVILSTLPSEQTTVAKGKVFYISGAGCHPTTVRTLCRISYLADATVASHWSTCLRGSSPMGAFLSAQLIWRPFLHLAPNTRP